MVRTFDILPRRLKTLPLVGLMACSIGLISCSKREEQKEAAPARVQESAKEKKFGVGSLAPDFEAVAHSGKRVRLSELKGKVVVLYFYPKDGTPGCVAEAKSFRDEHQELEQVGAVVIGVSSQDNESHRDFAKKHSLPFLLLPDEDSSIARSFRVGDNIFGLTQRVTFIIDKTGKIAKIYDDVSPKNHGEEILRDIGDLQ